MAGNQQFCLRWNNHQRTLISVFDSLLESGTLVDCTLAAEGQYLKAHKVVLSACSPYLGMLLSTHHEKHPILILKDIKFQELKAMLDYMYKGEVNISQEQLCTFLKAAESLQIKGLTESAGLNPECKEFEERIKRHDRKPSAPTPTVNHSNAKITRSPPSSVPENVPVQTPWSQKFTVPNYRPITPPTGRDGSLSPVNRKRRKQLHPTPNNVADESAPVPCTMQVAENFHETTQADPQDVLAVVSQSCNFTPSSTPFLNVTNIKTEVVDRSDEKVSLMDTESLGTLPVETVIKTEPKFADSKHTSDNPDTPYEDSVDDMTAEEEEEEVDENDTSRPGPSHSEDSQPYSSSYPVSCDSDGGTSSGQIECQGFDAKKRWKYHYMNTWESWSAAHPTVPAIHGIQPFSPNSVNNIDCQKEGVECPECGRHYKLKSSLRNHQKWECGKEPQFVCPYCNYRAKQKMHVARHIERMHREKLLLTEACIINNNSINSNNNTAAN